MSVLSRATRKQNKPRANDFWPTIDPRAVVALLPHLPENCYYAEPCAGGGHLIDLLGPHGPLCMWEIDLAPKPRRDENNRPIAQRDVFDLEEDDVLGLDCLITNPPWTRKILHAMIEHLVSLGKPVWLLFDAAWMFTAQAAPFMASCTDIVVVGRLRWIEGTKVDPPTDHAWYCFDKYHDESPPRFHPKPEKLKSPVDVQVGFNFKEGEM